MRHGGHKVQWLQGRREGGRKRNKKQGGRGKMKENKEYTQGNHFDQRMSKEEISNAFIATGHVLRNYSARCKLKSSNLIH